MHPKAQIDNLKSIGNGTGRFPFFLIKIHEMHAKRMEEEENVKENEILNAYTFCCKYIQRKMKCHFRANFSPAFKSGVAVSRLKPNKSYLLIRFFLLRHCFAKAPATTPNNDMTTGTYCTSPLQNYQTAKSVANFILNFNHNEITILAAYCRHLCAYLWIGSIDDTI